MPHDVIITIAWLPMYRPPPFVSIAEFVEMKHDVNVAEVPMFPMNMPPPE